MAIGTGFYIPNDNQGTYLLHYILPNTLMSSAPHLPASGGPGVWPVEAAQPGIGQSKFSYPGIQNSGKYINPTAGQGVEVAILDTSPIKNELDGALKLWPGHPLLSSLWGSNRKLELKPMRYISADWTNIDHFSPMGHRYLMPDHGLFVAGIINSIVPQAQLNLYEVLNHYGIGSYKSVYTGLKRVLGNYRMGQKLVINLSLVLSLPLVSHEGGSLSYLHIDPGITDRYRLPNQLLCIESMSVSFREI